MSLTPLYEPTTEPMRVVALMSGSGTNLVKILERQRLLQVHGTSPYQVVAVFSDVEGSNAEKIGSEWGLPVHTIDIAQFYRTRGSAKTMRTEIGKAVREEFDRELIDMMQPFDAQVAAYAGYMSAASRVLVQAYLGVNVHPADLTKRRENGEPMYTGDRAVQKAIAGGEMELRATTHLIAEKVDCGTVLMVSKPIVVARDDEKPLELLAEEHQHRLKEAGDWVIFPKTLEYLALGKFARDPSGLLHFEGQPIPNGIRLG